MVQAGWFTQPRPRVPRIPGPGEEIGKILGKSIGKIPREPHGCVVCEIPLDGEIGGKIDVDDVGFQQCIFHSMNFRLKCDPPNHQAS